MKRSLVLMIFAVLFFGCKKGTPVDSLIAAAAKNGAIAGSIYPANASVSVLAFDAQGKQFNASVNAGNGAFTFEGLQPGRYQVVIPVSPNAGSATNRAVDVVAGQTADAGVITMSLPPTSTLFVLGTLLPAGFGTAVTATNQKTGNIYTAILNATTGAFGIELPNGDYKIQFAVKKPVEAPADMQVTVAGKPVALGIINSKLGEAGTLTGSYSPMAAMATVKAINLQTGGTLQGLINRTSGTFEFPVLSPGMYKISFTAYAPYLVPADITAVVKTGIASEAGQTTFVFDVETKQITYKLDGVATIRYNLPATFSAGELKFAVSSLSISNNLPEIQSSTTKTIAVAVNGITAPGKYVIGTNGQSSISYTVTSSSAGKVKSSSTWSTTAAGGAGELEVTAIDPVKRTIKGTFSATLVSTVNASARKTVTAGAFYLSY